MKSSSRTESWSCPWDDRAFPSICAFLAVVALGVLWMCVELLVTTASGRSMYSLEPLDRFIAHIPWQVALFAMMGILVSVSVRVFSLNAESTGWVAVGLASWTFLGARLGEGILRRWAAHGGAIPRAMAALAVSAAAIGILMWLISRLGRFLPSSRRDRWPLAVWIGWSLFFLPSMHRVGPLIGGWGGGGPVAWMERLHPAHVLLGAVATILVVFAPSLSRKKLAASGLVASTLVAVLGLASYSHVSEVSSRQEQSDMPDILVILADTLRADHLGLVDGSSSLTPALDSVVRESVLFEHAFSPSNQTPRAMPGILTSLPHEMIGTHVGKDVVPLQELLKDAGYSTAGLSTNPFVSRNFGYHKGFDQFVDPNDVDEFLILSILRGVGTVFPRLSYGLGISVSSRFYRPAESVRRGAVEILENIRSPAFIYLHLMDAHGPYLPDRNWLTDEFRLRDFYSYFKFDYLKEKGVLNTPGFQPQLENIRQRYRGEILGMDSVLGQLIEDLRQSGRWDEMMVWLISDHGEAFGEHDWAGHGGHNLNNPVMQVPYLVKLPRSWQVQPRLESTPVSTFSLLPTTMALLGLPTEKNAFSRDLSALILRDAESVEENVIVSHGENSYSVIEWPWKLIVTERPEAGTRRELFDLSRDPREMENLVDQHPELVSGLEEHLGAWVENVSLGQVGSEGVDIDAGTLERLRSLGYIQ